METGLSFSTTCRLVNEKTRDFVYVQDVVEANILVAQHGKGNGSVYNIASGSRTSIRELFETTACVIGTIVEATPGPFRVGDIKDSYADISKARKELGFQPKVSLEEGIRRTVGHQKHG